MNWGKFIVITLGILVVLWLLLVFAYGNFFLMDNIVPTEGMEVEEWLGDYRICGGASALAGFVCAAIWFYIGNGYAGEGGISVKYYGLWIVVAVLGVACNFVWLPEAVEGAGLASVFVILLPVLLYYLASIFASASPVKYIPPLADVFNN